MSEETTTTVIEETNTSAEEGKNTESINDTGADTDTAQQNQARQERIDITQTREFKAALTAAMEKKIPQMKKQIAREISGESDGMPTVAELQEQLKSTEARARTFETKEQIRDFLTDSRNKTAVRPENMRSIEKLVFAEVEFDDSGEITNLKEAIDRVRSEAPSLFVSNTTQINGNTGRNQPGIVDFNEQLRAAAGYRPR